MLKANNYRFSPDDFGQRLTAVGFVSALHISRFKVLNKPRQIEPAAALIED